MRNKVIHKLFAACVCDYSSWCQEPAAKKSSRSSSRGAREPRSTSLETDRLTVRNPSSSCVLCKHLALVCVCLLNCHHNSVPEEVLSRPSERHDEDKAAPICGAATTAAKANSGDAAPSVGQARYRAQPSPGHRG